MKVHSIAEATTRQVHCLDGEYRQPNLLDYGWTLDDGVLKPLWYTGSALPNDHEITGRRRRSRGTTGTRASDSRNPTGIDWIQFDQ